MTTEVVVQPVYEVRLLGEFELTEDGRAVRVPLPSQRLLVMLAIEGRPVERAKLAWRLWPDIDEGRAAANLRSALWKLRDAAVATVVGRTEIALAPSVEVDLSVLRADAAALRGGLVPADLDLDRLARDLLPWWYDDWLVIERERFRQLRLHALERASTLLLGRNQFELALDAGLLAVGCDELRETAHRCIVRAHLAEGNVGEAMRQRDRYLDALRQAGLPLLVSDEMQALLCR